MQMRARILALAPALIIMGGCALSAVAGELILDMADLPPIDCGDTFSIAGRTCRIQPLDEVRCIADDYHDLMLLGWAMLIVDLGDLSDVTRVSALVETVDDHENSTSLWIYDANVPLAFVTNSTHNDLETLALDTSAIDFDSIRLTGLLLLLHEIRIETVGVPVESTTWSTVKAAYR